MSSAEKSRLWRESHPGYHADWQRRYRAAHHEDAAYQRAWRVANPDRIAAYTARYRARRVHVRRTYNLRNEYGMTPEQYAAMLEVQGGVCAICRQPETRVHYGKVVTLCVDHDHRTGRVRGLLCSTCNIFLGRVKDDPALLLTMAAYLTPVPKPGR